MKEVEAIHQSVLRVLKEGDSEGVTTPAMRKWHEAGDPLLTEEAKAKLEKSDDGACDVCGGSGKPLANRPCICGGTGRAWMAAVNLREELINQAFSYNTEKELKEKTMNPINVIHPKALAVLLTARKVYVLADDFTFAEGERRRIQFMNAREEWLAAGSPFLIDEEGGGITSNRCLHFIHFGNAAWKSPVDPCKGKDLQECETCLRKERERDKMRCTQIMGLSPAAQEFLYTNLKIEVININCPHCGGVIERKEKRVQRVYDKETGKIEGMFDDGPELIEYDLKDGRKAREIIQAVPWSSGPMIFLCLEINGKKEFLWSDEEIRKA